MSAVKQKNKQFLFDKIVGIIFTLIQPILGFLFSLRYANRKWFQIVVIILCTYFGYTMYVEDIVYDSSRYRDYFLEVYLVQEDYFSFLFSKINSIYVQDYYESSAAFFISRFTNDYQIYFAFLGFVFGIIYSRNIYLISNYFTKYNIFSVIFFLSFLCIYGPWAINGARFGTASQLFLYIIFSYFLFEKKKSLFLLLLLPLIHFSFLLPIFILGLYLLFDKLIIKFQFIFFLLFVVSFLLEFFILDFVSTIVNYFPPFLAEKMVTYTSVDAITEFNSTNEDLSILAKFSVISLKVYFFLSYIVIYFYNKKISTTLSKVDKQFISFFLFFASIISVVNFFPSFSRYVNLAVIINVVIFLKLISIYHFNNIFRNRVLLLVLCLFLLVVTLRSIRYGVLFLGDDFFMSSPLFIFFN
ncbi:hypothetical protein [Sphingobacterium rhinopitheci]|uniref:hypothetical protein n=1 Tax=Sphingobacterium rhinopitheci TaxID=2781960 RepID=UPI001F51E289|nr:hypothetical protein [Sphingobacterium rhinopitheci]MCI0920631.1 hypothetical protein [Sphingobacterium rhinopitheci]